MTNILEFPDERVKLRVQELSAYYRGQRAIEA